MFYSREECFIENSKAGYYVIRIRPNAKDRARIYVKQSIDEKYNLTKK